MARSEAYRSEVTGNLINKNYVPLLVAARRYGIAERTLRRRVANARVGGAKDARGRWHVYDPKEGLRPSRSTSTL